MPLLLTVDLLLAANGRSPTATATVTGGAFPFSGLLGLLSSAEVMEPVVDRPIAQVQLGRQQFDCFLRRVLIVCEDEFQRLLLLVRNHCALKKLEKK